MAKACNLTVRVDERMKQSAVSAAAYLDVSLSQVVRKAFQRLIRDAAEQRGREQRDAEVLGELDRQARLIGGGSVEVTAGGVSRQMRRAIDREEQKKRCK